MMFSTALLIFSCLLLSGAPLVKGYCAYGNPPPPEGRYETDNGHFVDLDNPLSCSGLLVSLNLCFYTSTITEYGMYTFYFRILRVDTENDDVLRQTHLMEKEIEIGPSDVLGQTLACRDHVYAENEYVNVSSGDYIAVYIPSLSKPLSIVGRDIPDTMLYTLPFRVSHLFSPTTLSRSSLNPAQDRALHISADIIPLDNYFSGFIIPLSGVPPAPSEPITTSSSVTSASVSSLATTPRETTSSENAGNRKSPKEATPSTGGEVASTPVDATPSTPKEIILSTTQDIETSITVTASFTDRDVKMSATAKVNQILSKSIYGNSAIATVSQTPSLTPVTTTENKTRAKPWVMATVISVGLQLIITSLTMIIVLFACVLRRKRQKQVSKITKDEEVPTVPVNPVDRPCVDDDHTYAVIETALCTPSSHYNNKDDTQQQQVIDQDNVYSKVGPEVDNEEVVVKPSADMHYEMGLFDIYSSAIGVANSNLTTRLREVVPLLNDKPLEPFHKPASEEEAIRNQLSLQNPAINIPAHQLQVKGHLGSGQFAGVKRGIWISSDGERDVAIKTLHIDTGDENRVKCLQEAAIMAQFHHPNIVLLHGIVIDEDRNISLVMEFLHGGDLSEILVNRHRTNGPDANTPQVLLNYCSQITLGMLYLSDKGFVHRDLAARNVLISSRDICKIGDFGMSRDLEDSHYYHSAGGIIPVKWTAPEAAFYRKYSSASDVWSYGCVIYEIWSLGEKPFGNLLNEEVLQRVTTGNRLPPPPGCPYEIYKLMMDCWNPTPDARPSFKDILILLIGDEEQLLTIPFEDASTDPEACYLGVNLMAGCKMYSTLQTMYL